MNKDKAENVDVTRSAIEAKIGTKKTSTTKLDERLESLDETEVVYQKAIEKAKDKITTLENKIAGFASSRESLKADKAKREAELVLMEKILVQYDEMHVEAEGLSQVMNAKLKEHEWYPGDPEEKRGSLERDQDYLAARKRKLEINDWMSDVLGTVNRIFYSRGEND